MAIHKYILVWLALASWTGAQTITSSNRHQIMGNVAYTTSSFSENRGTRFHAGVDFGTEMREGWPVLAPEDGQVIVLRQSPFSYGRNFMYRGVSGHVWLFAHLSGFAPRLDSLFELQKLAQQSNDLIWNLPAQVNATFHTNDTIAFSGSTGIGNPHLHVEMRDSSTQVAYGVCDSALSCPDTLAPQLLAAAVWDASNKNPHVSITGREALAGGCLEVDPSMRDPRMALKLVDYSRAPKENPMSLYSISLTSQGKSLFNKTYKQQTYGKMIRIREELLWSEEADTAGDWHFLGKGVEPNENITWDAMALAKNLRVAKNGKGKVIDLTLQDMARNTTQLSFTPAATCPADSAPPKFTNLQDSVLFTFLARPWFNWSICTQNTSVAIHDSTGKLLLKNACSKFDSTAQPVTALLAKLPKARSLVLMDSAKHTRIIYLAPLPQKTETPLVVQGGGLQVTFTPAPLLSANAIAWEQVDSLRDSIPGLPTVHGIAIHPKGLHILGNVDICADLPQALPLDVAAPITSLSEPLARNVPRLYWLGETSRLWFVFSKQRVERFPDTLGSHARSCTTLDELRDLTFSVDTTAPQLGDARDTVGMIRGQAVPVWRIPVKEYWSGIPDGKAIRATVDGRWISVEFDSFPSEIVVNKANLKPHSVLTLEVHDEAGNRATRKYVVTL